MKKLEAAKVMDASGKWMNERFIELAGRNGVDGLMAAGCMAGQM
jgi:coenzyme F420-reducing hydrogenase delta subunit